MPWLGVSITENSKGAITYLDKFLEYTISQDGGGEETAHQ